MTKMIQIKEKNEQIKNLQVSSRRKRREAGGQDRQSFKDWKHRNDNKNHHFKKKRNAEAKILIYKLKMKKSKTQHEKKK